MNGPQDGWAVVADIAKRKDVTKVCIYLNHTVEELLFLFKKMLTFILHYISNFVRHRYWYGGRFNVDFYVFHDQVPDQNWNGKLFWKIVLVVYLLLL